jgi:GT2 family glycosyltransferase
VDIDRFGYGSDIGYLQPDDGRFATARDIVAWSGAVVAMRTSYLAGTGTFDDELFMYYEDVDLSLRGSQRGWRYRVRPDAMARHRHQAAASRSALTALYLSERNRLLVAKRNSSRATFIRLLVHHLVITGSYAAHDIVASVLAGSWPRWEPTKTRVRALGGALFPRSARLRSKTSSR